MNTLPNHFRPRTTYTGSRYLFREAFKCLREAMFTLWSIELPQRRKRAALRFAKAICAYHPDMSDDDIRRSLGDLLFIFFVFALGYVGM